MSDSKMLAEYPVKKRSQIFHMYISTLDKQTKIINICLHPFINHKNHEFIPIISEGKTF